MQIRTESGGIAFNKPGIKSQGKACSYNVLGLVSFGDSGIAEAKDDGGLKRVYYFDTEIFGILGLFGSVCTVAYGK